MSAHFGSADIRRKYDEFARRYALMERLQEPLGIGKLRRRLLGKASGEVLEVACGTGVNFAHYPEDCRVTAVDLSLEMIGIARERAATAGTDITLRPMDGEKLEFPDDSFDTVVSSLTLCTFPDPVAALLEMGRVCRGDGRILLLEHGRSDREWLGGFQDRWAESHAKQLGCHWNREPFELVGRAGLRQRADRRSFFGVFHEIEATAPKTATEHSRLSAAAEHRSGRLDASRHP